MHFLIFKFFRKVELILYCGGPLYSSLRKLILNIRMDYEISYLLLHQKAANAQCEASYVLPMERFQH